MRSMLFPLALLVFLPGASLAGETDHPEELVVLGRLDDQEYLESLDELGMNGLIEARLHVTRVVKGRSPSRALRIRYIAHGFRRGDRTYRFRLRRDDDGAYLACSEGGRGFACQ